jgi:formyltetrahydrofolate-dependent phosphoribosylglycinamide formyltransferase
MLAITRACEEGRLDAEVSVVVAPNSESPGARTAREVGLNVAVVAPGENYAAELEGVLRDVDAVCLAGYMRLLPVEVLRAHPDRVLNVHPALLPAFGGKGMYGMRVHEAVIASGSKESGCTVHLVNEVYDEGRILVQHKVPVLDGDTPESLAARVLNEEHAAYVEAIAQVLNSI